MANEIINRVASSGILTFDLSEYYPNEEIVEIDLAEFLFQGLILKEKDFRQALSESDWDHYTAKHVGIFSSADAIIPVWAYMLITSYLRPSAASVHFGNKQEVLSILMDRRLAQTDPEEFRDKRVVVKGCGEKEIPASAYLTATWLLQPYAKSIMYGEPCSTVPVYKKPKQ
ncbi:MAG: DUF2480 family protein [Bacteroidia bacterium]